MYFQGRVGFYRAALPWVEQTLESFNPATGTYVYISPFDAHTYTDVPELIRTDYMTQAKRLYTGKNCGGDGRRKSWLT